MEKGEFDDAFKVLDKASDRLRSVIYVFIIVYMAMLLYGLSAFLYPARQYAYEDLSMKARCFYANFPGAVCQSLKQDIDAHKITPPMTSDISLSLWEHQLQNLFDDSVKTRTFSFPIFGLETDRDLLWVLFPLVGIIGYYIVLLALGSALRLFHCLVETNADSAFRLRMIQSTLVITTPLETTGPGRPLRRGDLDPLLKALWRVLALGVCFIPIFVSVLMVVDQTNVIAAWIRRVPGEAALKHPSAPFLLQLVVEAILIMVELRLFVAVTQMGRLFGACQTDVEARIRSAEAKPPGRPATPGGLSLAAE
ncbi:MAG TPA: hypothetical protein VGC09_16805 [Rhodopila sp.]